MSQINTYPTQAAYAADTSRSAIKSAASIIQGLPKYDGVNVIVPANRANLSLGDIPVFDLQDNTIKLIKGTTFVESRLDTSRYICSNALFYRAYPTHCEFMAAKNLGSALWAAPAEYTIKPDLNQPGGFTLKTTNNSSTKVAVVHWEAGTAIEELVQQINSVFNCAKASGNREYIIISHNTYTKDNTSISEAQGEVKFIDHTLTAQRPGTDEVGVNHNWQSEVVRTCFPGIDYMAASSVQYAKSGHNLSHRTIGSMDTFKAWNATNGKTVYTPESSIDAMTEQTFLGLASSDNEAARALYIKYGGDYDKYLAARIYDPLAKKGINLLCNQAPALTKALSECFFSNHEAQQKPVYLAANLCHTYGITHSGVTTGFEPGNWVLPTTDGLFFKLRDDVRPVLNAIINRFSSKTTLSVAHEWSSEEYYGTYAWYFSGTSGALLNYHVKCNSYRVWPSLALKL